MVKYYLQSFKDKDMQGMYLYLPSKIIIPIIKTYLLVNMYYITLKYIIDLFKAIKII